VITFSATTVWKMVLKIHDQPFADSTQRLRLGMPQPIRVNTDVAYIYFPLQLVLYFFQLLLSQLLGELLLGILSIKKPIFLSLIVVKVEKFQILGNYH